MQRYSVDFINRSTVGASLFWACIYRYISSRDLNNRIAPGEYWTNTDFIVYRSNLTNIQAVFACLLLGYLGPQAKTLSIKMMMLGACVKQIRPRVGGALSCMARRTLGYLCSVQYVWTAMRKSVNTNASVLKLVFTVHGVDHFRDRSRWIVSSSTLSGGGNIG